MATSSSDARVFAGVDAVTVPDGTALGQHFTAHVWAMQRGARVPRLRHFWRASGNAPVIATATVAVAQGPRHAQRPSAVARRVSGTAGAQAIDHQRTEQCSITEWQTSVELPIELHEHDVGWLPGPVGGRNGRPFPTFTGESSGPRDRELTSRSTARRIMRSVQLSRSFKDTVVTLTRQHAQQWSAEHDRCDGTERCFSAADLEPVHVELWAALAVRVAKLNPSIPADRLWDATHHCYDAAVDAACTHTQWQWLNRHLSFGAMRVVGANGDSDSDGGDGSDSSSSDAAEGAVIDRYRSRRMCSDIARAQAPKAFWPGQHLGFDDLIRVTRHADGRRVRHKAAVHSGRANDGLNDARSHYFMWWEEQGSRRR